MSKAIGNCAEKQAVGFLKSKKLTILDTNYHSHWGEIDIIARENDILAFIEVRYRKSTTYGTAFETVDKNKQQRIIKTALHFLSRHTIYDQLDLRFDLVSMTGNLDNPEIDRLPSAFMA